MSHYIAEIVIPPTENIEQSIKEAMWLGEVEGEDDAEHPDWWDFYVIGGRFSGQKIISAIDEDLLIAFNAELTRRKVTVGALVCGKQEISPASQIPMVDELWREMVPGHGDKCLLFKHARGEAQYKSLLFPDDICTVADLHDKVACGRLMVCGPHYSDKKRLAVDEMWTTSVWNHVSWQKTDFDGLVKAGLAKMREHPNKRTKFRDDWLVVTVDYHN